MKAMAILAHHMDAQGILGRESVARLEAAVRFDTENPCDLFLTTGWAYRKDCTKKIGAVMADQLVSLYGVDRAKVVVDENARDTVGDAYFLNKNVISPREIQEVIVVTSDYHARRAEAIFKTILAPNVKVQVVGADVGLAMDEALSRHEENSLQSFRETFDGVDFTDDSAVCKALSKKHPFYNGVVYEKLACG
ncbi:MAG: YdcF family protein [Roseobacter sp.]